VNKVLIVSKICCIIDGYRNYIQTMMIQCNRMLKYKITFYYESPDNLQMEKEIRLNDEVMLVVEIAIFNCFQTLLASVSLTYVCMQTIVKSLPTRSVVYIYNMWSTRAQRVKIVEQLCGSSRYSGLEDLVRCSKIIS
jgi:hypothetical protein